MAELTNQSGEACASDSKSEELFRPLVTCGICLQLYVDPVALLDCLHLACGSCAKQWLKSSTTCHQCREPVRGARDSHHTLAVVEAYQSVAPNSSLCQERTPEIITTLRVQYKPGQTLTVGEGDDEDSNGNDSEIEGEDDESYDSERGTWSYPGGLQLHDNSCPFCSPAGESESRFVCPQPCTRPDDDVGVRTIPLGHTLCSQCIRFLPVRHDLPGTSCVVCSRTVCSEFGEACLSDHQENGVELQLEVLRAMDFSAQDDLPLMHAFGDNESERDIFRSWATNTGLGLQELFGEILTFRGPNLPKASWHGNTHGAISSTDVNVDDKVCANCALDLVEASLFDWWLSKRQSGVVELPDSVTSRPDCWYGIECRTARHNYRHARDYNHICLKTVANQQESHDLPENGNRYVTESGDLDDVFPAFSPSAIIFRDKGKEPSFMCSSVRETETGRDIIPGKTTIWGPGFGVQVYYGERGRERLQRGQVQLLMDTRNMHWVQASRGVIPDGCRPVVGGQRVGASGTEELYHCAVWWHGQRVPGYAGKDIEHAAITWGGQEWYFKDNYEILCWN
ncbi:unnamed protein product [Rhizoctonia solani]|uniref:RING-type domain-containing protein n=1 Tax=Rhizoctonia solani TaxID=456999 RepID=A0A8H3BFY3_9AGAM|nr:unnamed protein product [Rhizoctonia solani]